MGLRQKWIQGLLVPVIVGLVLNGMAVGQTPVPPAPLQLFVTNEALILYVSSAEAISLDGLQFVVSRNSEPVIITITPRFGVFNLTNNVAYPGTCYVYHRQGVEETLPTVCSDETKVFEVDAAPGDIFWYDTVRNQKLDIAIARSGNTLGLFCPATLAQCEINLPPLILNTPSFPSPTPTPLPTYTPQSVSSNIPTPTPTLRPTLPSGGVLPAPSSDPFTTFNSPQGEITHIRWSPDGASLVTAHANGYLCLWNTSEWNTAVPACLRADNGDTIKSIEWNPDATNVQFATASEDGWVQIWDVYLNDDPNFNLLKKFQVGDNGIHDISWNHSNPNLLVITEGGSSNGRLKIWSLQKDMLVNNWPINDPLAVTWRSTGRYIGSVENTGAIRVIDSESQLGFVQIDDYTSGVKGIDVAWNPVFNRNNLATLGSDGSVRLYTYTPGEICPNSRCPYVTVAQNLNNANELQFSPDGLLIAVNTANSVEIMEAREPYELVGKYAAHNLNDTLTSVTWQPDSNALAAADSKGKLYVWSVAHEPLTHIQLENHWSVANPGPVNALDWNPSGQQIAVVDTDRNLSDWDITNQRQIGKNVGHTQIPLSLDWNPSRSLIATGGCGPSVILWDVAVLPQITLRAPFNLSVCMTSIAFNPDGEVLATGDQNGILRIWDWQNQVQIRDSRSVNLQINDIEWNRSGTQLATVSDTGLFVVWDVTRNPPQEVFIRQPEPSTPITTLSWAPDGMSVATGSISGWIVIWNLDSSVTSPGFTGGYRLDGHTSPVTSVSWSVTGDRIVSASQDGQIIVWEARTGQRLGETSLENGAVPLDVKWSPVDENAFAVTDNSGYLYIWRFEQ